MQIDQAVPNRIHANIEATSATSATTVYAGTTNYSIFIVNISISTDTAQWVRIVGDGGGVIIAKKYLPANSVWSKTFNVEPRRAPQGSGIYITCGGSSGNISVDFEGYLG